MPIKLATAAYDSVMRALWRPSRALERRGAMYALPTGVAVAASKAAIAGEQP
jgi:hypothetical protein